jgi:hypothetical protein
MTVRPFSLAGLWWTHQVLLKGVDRPTACHLGRRDRENPYNQGWGDLREAFAMASMTGPSPLRPKSSRLFQGRGLLFQRTETARFQTGPSPFRNLVVAGSCSSRAFMPPALIPVS